MVSAMDADNNTPQIEPGRGIICRADGVYLDTSEQRPLLRLSIDALFGAPAWLSGLDYAILIKVLYGCGPELPPAAGGAYLQRCADAIMAFDPARHELYKGVKIAHGQAEYFFEPVFLSPPGQPDAPGVPTRLNCDEFIADLWQKGVRFGIDVAAVRAAIASGKSERVLVARQLDAVPGTDARIDEVSHDLHRSDAPRQLASGKLDLVAFQNRFPQIKQGVRLLKKVPRRDGRAGFALDGSELLPPLPQDLDFAAMAGPGTEIENTAEGEFLVARQGGFLNVDSRSNQLSVNAKIVSREGVSLRTTGNLNLQGDYEEFGEVQEKRVIEGSNITVHADVYGNIVSRGGAIVLNHNLVGGNATNAAGDITVRGVASGARIQTQQGCVTATRAESCIISGTRVVLEHAINCEIIADEVKIAHAEGCAVAARRIEIDSAGPRKQAEMLVFALLPDLGKLDAELSALAERTEQFDRLLAVLRAEREKLTSQPDVRKYLMLANKIAKKELVLTSDQQAPFQRLAQAAGPALKAVSKLALQLKQAETERQAGVLMAEQLRQRRQSQGGTCSIALRMLEGETLVRRLPYNPENPHPYDLPAAEIRQRLRGAHAVKHTIFAGKVGAFEWTPESAA